MKCIILAGGKGTRLQSVVSNVPKPMAPINGKPFLDILISKLLLNGVDEFIISVGYMKEVLFSHYQRTPSFISFSVEETPLLTGGAIKKALTSVGPETVLVVNGDTSVDFDLGDMLSFHCKSKADVTIASVYLGDSSRYGRLQLSNSRVLDFLEKSSNTAGQINAGVYLINSNILKCEERAIFSFEEWLRSNLKTLNVQVFTQCKNFIDIGVPEDYKKAQAFNFGV